jgi:hypothetical protein
MERDEQVILVCGHMRVREYDEAFNPPIVTALSAQLVIRDPMGSLPTGCGFQRARFSPAARRNLPYGKGSEGYDLLIIA